MIRLQSWLPRTLFEGRQMHLDDSHDSFAVHETNAESDIEGPAFRPAGAAVRTALHLELRMRGRRWWRQRDASATTAAVTRRRRLTYGRHQCHQQGSIDLFTIATATGVPSPVAGSPITDGPTPAAIAIDPLKRFLYVDHCSGEDPRVLRSIRQA